MSINFPYLSTIQDLSNRQDIDVYLVGGFLRDHFLGIRRQDFDFAVSKDALKLAQQFSRKISGAYVLLDKERGCARVAKKTADGPKPPE